MKKLKELFLKKKLIALLLILISIPAIKSLLTPLYFPTQDSIHVTRIYEMDQSLRAGQFPVRWASDLRYGEPLFNFYAPLPYYAGTLLHVLSFRFIDISKILFGLSIILSGVAMYFLAKEFFGTMGG